MYFKKSICMHVLNNICVRHLSIYWFKYLLKLCLGNVCGSPPPTPKFQCLHSALNTPESSFSASAENGCVHMRHPANFTKCAHITFFTYFLCNDNLILISNYALITKNFILYVCFENKTIMQLHIYHKYW